jgi:hypothetical protein
MITPPPLIPLITEPATFAVRAQDWTVWQANELYPFLEEGASLIGLSTSGTSTTSNSVGTGSKSFTTQTGKGFIPGMSLSIARTSAPTNRMFAIVTSYNSGTGALVVNSQAFEGSGTYTDWSIALAYNGLISDDAYGSGWNGSQNAPTKNAVYDKIETVDAAIDDVAQSVVNIGISKYEQTAAQTITSAGTLTISHSLGIKPKLYSIWIKCTTAELNYSVNDEVELVGMFGMGTGAAALSQGISIIGSSSNIILRFGAATGALQILNKTTGVQLSITNTSWELYIRMWA